MDNSHIIRTITILQYTGVQIYILEWTTIHIYNDYNDSQQL